MGQEIKNAKEKISELFNQDKKKAKELDLQNKQGVYLIYKGKSIIYAGKSKNLKERIKNQHISGAKDGKNSIFRKKLHEKYKIQYGKSMKDWIINNLKFSYIYIEDFDLCYLVEALAIIKARKMYGKNLLNKNQ